MTRVSVDFQTSALVKLSRPELRPAPVSVDWPAQSARSAQMTTVVSKQKKNLMQFFELAVICASTSFFLISELIQVVLVNSVLNFYNPQK